MDLIEDGRRLKMMPVVDEYTRECSSIDVVGRSITAEDVVETPASLFRRRGEPSFIRSDNGPEFVAEAVKRWLEVWGVGTLSTSNRVPRGRTTPTRRRSSVAFQTNC
jgi:putative transposase